MQNTAIRDVAVLALFFIFGLISHPLLCASSSNCLNELSTSTIFTPTLSNATKRNIGRLRAQVYKVKSTVRHSILASLGSKVPQSLLTYTFNIDNMNDSTRDEKLFVQISGFHRFVLSSCPAHSFSTELVSPCCKQFALPLWASELHFLAPRKTSPFIDAHERKTDVRRL